MLGSTEYLAGMECEWYGSEIIWFGRFVSISMIRYGTRIYHYVGVIFSLRWASQGLRTWVPRYGTCLT